MTRALFRQLNKVDHPRLPLIYLVSIWKHRGRLEYYDSMPRCPVLTIKHEAIYVLRSAPANTIVVCESADPRGHWSSK